MAFLELIIFKSFLFATLFSVIEYFWHATTFVDEKGEIFFRPFDKRCRKGFTTFAQWWVNLLCIPMVLAYHEISYNYYGTTFDILLSPFALWALEIVEGKILRLVYGKNVAWNYFGANSYFSGDIKISLKQYVIWVIMYASFYPIHLWIC